MIFVCVYMCVLFPSLLLCYKWILNIDISLCKHVCTLVLIRGGFDAAPLIFCNHNVKMQCDCTDAQTVGVFCV